MRFEIHKAVSSKIMICWDVTPKEPGRKVSMFLRNLPVCISTLLPRRWRQQVLQQCWYLPIKLHDITTQKAIIFMSEHFSNIS
jgi:hypothetical protein